MGDRSWPFRARIAGIMAPRKLLLVTTVLLLAISFAPRAAAPVQEVAPEYGPAKGTLVIVGGGSTDGTTIMEKFIELGGGAENGKFVVVPTAGGNFDSPGVPHKYVEATVLASWAKRGVKN